MANTILVGAQWGDEGKGKIIDVLTEQADVVVRSQGGANAGHTVRVGAKEYILHLIPSGILRRGKVCLIGNGVVINPTSLVGELDGLKQKKVNVKGRLYISDKAHLVMPYHRELEACAERARAKIRLARPCAVLGRLMATRSPAPDCEWRIWWIPKNLNLYCVRECVRRIA